MRKLTKGKGLLGVLLTALLLCALVVPAAPVLAAESATFAPDKDAYVDNQYPDDNFGTESILTVVGEFPLWKHAYIHFDLSSLPSDAVINSAKLSLYMTSGPAWLFPWELFRVPEDWSETGITWNNCPEPWAGQPNPAFPKVADAYSYEPPHWMEWESGELTSNVQGFVDGSFPNYGWYVGCTLSSWNIGYFASREYADETLRPKLEVTYMLPTSMSILPDTQTVDAGDPFTVDVVVDPAVPSLAAQCDLSFDASLVQVDSVTEGTLYSGGGTTYFNAGVIDNVAGTVTGIGVSLLGGTPVTGVGTFATIHMTAKVGDGGTSPLTLSGVIVANASAEPIPDVVINDGEVVVGAGGTLPTVTTNAATDVVDESATLNGTLDDLDTASSVDVSFEWGATTAYGNETTPQTMTSTGTFSVALSGLTPGATYHFRVKAVGDGTSYGSDLSFVTTGEAPSSATLTADILPAVSISIDPTSIDFGELVAGDTSDPHTITITNLGGKSVDVTAEVTGDSLYVNENGLWLDEGLWDVYSATIHKDEYTMTDATLHVGVNYAGLGTQEGTLIFWAEVTP